MYTRRGRRALVSTGITVVLLLAVGYLLAPAQFGGHTTYLITAGNSMEPRLQKGDFVLARWAPVYRVGDVVAYRDPDVGMVLHRIVDTSDGRFVLKGDHNTWQDPYHPSSNEVAGKLWVRLPAAGTVLATIRIPHNIALLVGVLGVMAMTSMEEHERRRRGRRHGAARESGPGPFGRLPTSARDGLLAVAGMTALTALILGVIAFRRPAERSVTTPIRYQQTGTFRYSAAVPAGIYDTDHLAAGEPVFLRLTRTVDVQFDYRFRADAPHDISGRVQLVAQIGSEANGWRRTLELMPATAFRGDTAVAAGTLDLQLVQELITWVEEQTGVKGRSYTVTVVPTVTTEGTVAGAALQDQFAPPLVFKLDAFQLALDRVGETKADPTTASQTGTVARPHRAPAVLSLLVLHPTVAQVRALALIGLAVAAVAALVAGLLTVLARSQDEPARIHARYGPMLLDVRGGAAAASARVVEMMTIDDLARLAAQDGRLLLHEQRGPHHRYFYSDGETVYEYTSVSSLWPADAGAREGA